VAYKSARAMRIVEALEDNEPGVEAAPLDLSALDAIVGYPLRRAQLAVFADFARRFAQLALTPAQYATLAAIQDNPGRKQSEIAAALGVLKPNFVAMLDEFERRGLSERLRSGADRRANAVTLTEAGEALFARARIIQAQQDAAVDRLLGAEKRATLVALLNELTALA
jgi:DNA-binding MarR family transcriptional regulator